jgi:hypothetical protein
MDFAECATDMGLVRISHKGWDKAFNRCLKDNGEIRRSIQENSYITEEID